MRRYPKDYDYIANKYGIRPMYGERVRESWSPREGVVKRERPSTGYRVAVKLDGRSDVNFYHPRDLVYLDREAQP